MSEPTKRELENFVRIKDLDVDGIYDKDSAIKHFRDNSKKYKAERNKFEQMLNEAYERGYQMEGKLHDMTNERNTLIDDIAILKANNDRLMRRNQKLEAYVRMWEKLTKWKQGKLAKRCNNDLLHELSYTMNELERDMYKGRE